MNRWSKDITCIAVVFGVSFGVAAETCRCQTRVAAAETLWYWSGDCRQSKTVGVDVLLDGKSVYHSSFAICRMQRSEVRTKQTGQALSFSFKGGHTFQGEHRTTSKENIEANLWQAGGEANGVLLGVSFSTKEQVLLNTVHLAKPDQTSESKLDPGMLIRTYPLPAAHHGNRTTYP